MDSDNPATFDTITNRDTGAPARHQSYYWRLPTIHVLSKIILPETTIYPLPTTEENSRG